MIKSFGRIDAIVKLHKWRFFISQFMMFIAALATVGYSTMITPLVNQGMVAGNTEVAIDIGINMRSYRRRQEYADKYLDTLLRYRQRYDLDRRSRPQQVDSKESSEAGWCGASGSFPVY